MGDPTRVSHLPHPSEALNARGRRRLGDSPCHRIPSTFTSRHPTRLGQETGRAGHAGATGGHLRGRGWPQGGPMRTNRQADRPPRSRSLSSRTLGRPCFIGTYSPNTATRFLLANLPEIESPLPGIRNVGLLATQELRFGVPLRSDWHKAVTKSTPLLRLRGRHLM